MRTPKIIFALTCFITFFHSVSSHALTPDKMALIPEGLFEMGSRQSLRELDPTAIMQLDRHMLGPENPSHEVFLDAFYMDLYEVTNEEYSVFMAETGMKKPGYFDRPGFNRPKQPVVGLFWKEAKKYCLWRKKRLPTEAEWEKAARGGQPVLFPWGNENPDKELLNYNEENSSPAEVGQYEKGKSGYGVYDMAGNVAEWVEDWHFPEYYLFSPKKNPPGPNKGAYKVIRGGHWINNGQDVLSFRRNASAPKARSKTIGFRCAKDAVSP